MPTNDPEYMKNYQKARREALKAKPEMIALPENVTPVEKIKRDLREEVITAEEIAPEGSAVGEDRAAGLPRTNYYGDWVSTIQGMNGHLIGKILDHPSIKTASRSK